MPISWPSEEQRKFSFFFLADGEVGLGLLRMIVKPNYLQRQWLMSTSSFPGLSYRMPSTFVSPFGIYYNSKLGIELNSQPLSYKPSSINIVLLSWKQQRRSKAHWWSQFCLVNSCTVNSIQSVFKNACLNFLCRVSDNVPPSAITSL